MFLILFFGITFSKGLIPSWIEVSAAEIFTDILKRNLSLFSDCSLFSLLFLLRSESVLNFSLLRRRLLSSSLLSLTILYQTKRPWKSDTQIKNECVFVKACARCGRPWRRQRRCGLANGFRRWARRTRKNTSKWLMPIFRFVWGIIWSTDRNEKKIFAKGMISRDTILSQHWRSRRNLLTEH